MAIFKSTTFGKISGKYGDALATKSKATGKNYLRVASEPTNPRTDKQVMHRTKFGFINTVLRPFYPVFKNNFGGNQGIRYAINMAFKDAIVGEYPDYRINLPSIIFSQGGIDTAGNTQFTKTAEGKIKLDWDTTVLLNSKTDDRLNVVFYNENTDQTLLLNTEITRTAGSTILDMPAIWIGSTIHCWLYFTAVDGIHFSNSQYVDNVEL